MRGELAQSGAVVCCVAQRLDENIAEVCIISTQLRSEQEKLAPSLLLPQQLIGIEEPVFVCLSYRVQRLASLVYHESSYENITSITYHTFLQTA